MPRFDADLLIVGGGPAGLATAHYARAEGLSVIVAEPRSTPIDKACGEGIMPGGLALLRGLGVEPLGIPFTGITYVGGARRAFAPFRAGPGLGVRRTTLHAALAHGVECIPRRITDVTQTPDAVVAGGIRARWLIAADGLHSTIRRRLGIRTVAGNPRRYGLRAHFATSPWSDSVEVWWSPDGEAYVTPVAPDLVGIAVLSRGRVWLDAFPQLAQRLPAVAAPLRGAGPLRQVVSRRVAGRVLLVGDAAGYEDALTGEGISLALKQASAAVDAIVDGDPARYEPAWRRLTREYRLLTRVLVLTTAAPGLRRALVPAAARFPTLFTTIVNRLAH